MSDSRKKLKVSIELTPQEQQICDLLKEVVAERNLKTTMRVAGGWVRDKVIFFFFLFFSFFHSKHLSLPSLLPATGA